MSESRYLSHKFPGTSKESILLIPLPHDTNGSWPLFPGCQAAQVCRAFCTQIRIRFPSSFRLNSFKIISFQLQSINVDENCKLGILIGSPSLLCPLGGLLWIFCLRFLSWSWPEIPNQVCGNGDSFVSGVFRSTSIFGCVWAQIREIAWVITSPCIFAVIPSPTNIGRKPTL